MGGWSTNYWTSPLIYWGGIFETFAKKIPFRKCLLHQPIDCNNLLCISAMITSSFGNSGKNQKNKGRTFQIFRAAQNLRYSSVLISYLNYLVASLDCLVRKNLISWWISLNGRQWKMKNAFLLTLDFLIFPLCPSPKWGESFNLKLIPKGIWWLVT